VARKEIAVTQTVIELPHLELTVARSIELGFWWHGADYADDMNRIYWFETGQAQLELGGRKIPLRPGRLYLIPAHTVFSFRCRENAWQHYIHFRGAYPGGTPLTVRLALREAVKLPPLAPSLLNRLEFLTTESPDSHLMEKCAILLQLLSWFVVSPKHIPREKTDTARFAPVLDYVEARLKEDLSISLLAEIIHMERTHFSKRFHAVFGVTPAAYIRRRRIETAMRILREEEVTLDIVAERTGFFDAFHFSRTFKALTGCSPKAFRQRNSIIP
jgi:AraC-like DNA-binding protein